MVVMTGFCNYSHLINGLQNFASNTFPPSSTSDSLIGDIILIIVALAAYIKS